MRPRTSRSRQHTSERASPYRCHDVWMGVWSTVADLRFTFETLHTRERGPRLESIATLAPLLTTGGMYFIRGSPHDVHRAEAGYCTAHGQRRCRQRRYLLKTQLTQHRPNLVFQGAQAHEVWHFSLVFGMSRCPTATPHDARLPPIYTNPRACDPPSRRQDSPRRFSRCCLPCRP